MIKYSKAFLFITVILLLMWGLPWAWHFLFAKPGSYPFTIYSCVAHQFVAVDRSSGSVAYLGEDGTIYTEKQFDSILPTLYNRQLVSDGRFPAQINGVEIDNRTLQIEKFMFRHKPSDINVKRPGLYPLFEGMSGRVDLQMPGDVFRMSNRMEFVDMEENQVNEERSQRFTQALLDKGFHFPAGVIAGDQNVRKEYDEGYLMTDREGQMFHVKRLKDRPFVRNTEISGVKVKYIFPTTFRNRRFYGFISDEDQNFYVLNAKTYELKPLPIPALNPEKETITIFGDPFYWTVQVLGEDGLKIYAIDANDYSLVATKVIPAEESQAAKIGKYIFPAELSFTVSTDQYVWPRFTDFSWWGTILWALLITGYIVMKVRLNRKKQAVS